jgi:hypothetical protein
MTIGTGRRVSQAWQGIGHGRTWDREAAQCEPKQRGDAAAERACVHVLGELACSAAQECHAFVHPAHVLVCGERAAQPYDKDGTGVSGGSGELRIALTTADIRRVDGSRHPIEHKVDALQVGRAERTAMRGRRVRDEDEDRDEPADL